MIGEKDPWDTLAEKLIRMDTEAKKAVIQGQPQTYEAYREEVGYLRAVAEIRECITEMFKRKPSFTERE